MNNLAFILQIIALVCFLLVFFNVRFPKEPRSPYSWIGAGLFCWLLSLMIVGELAVHAIRN